MMGAISISAYGIVLAVSYLLGIFLFWRWGRREGFSSDDLFDLALVSSLAAIAGGKLPPMLLAISSDFFWSGAIMAGAISLLVFASFKRWSFFRLLGLTALALSFAEAAGFIGLAFLEIQSPWMAAGGAVRAGLVYFVYRRFSPELTIFLYLMLEGFLLYFSRGYLSLALAGAGVIGLVWIAIRKRFKVKRRNGK